MTSLANSDEQGIQFSLFAENKVLYTTIERRSSILRVYTKETLIEELKAIRDMGWIASSRPGNSGSVGNTLEDLLGIEENNLPIPNAVEWELKCRRTSTNSLVTLFHMEPSPRALRFVPRVFLPLYGWRHQEADGRYDENEMSFRQTISGNRRSDRGFMVTVDHTERKLLISFDSTAVDIRHRDWLNSVAERVGLGELNPQPYWGFDDLRNKAGTKLLNCFYVQAETKKKDGQEYFRYSKIMILQGFSLERLVAGIEAGYIYIDFDARTRHNHGTKFRLHQEYLPSLYDKNIAV